MTAIVSQLREAFASTKLIYQNEADLQQQIADLLTNWGVVYVREFIFDRSNRIDFFIFGLGLGIEVKIKGSLYPILRQLHRYAEFPAVRELILICPKPWALPATLANKPVWRVALFASLI